MTTLSEKIRGCRDGVVHNPYQGKDKKVLFVCSMGILRSATGARLYASRHNTRCAGTWADALIPVTPTLLEWADEVVFVNKSNYEQIKTRYEREGIDIDEILTIKVLDIPDAFPHMAPELVQAFNDQYEPVELGLLNKYNEQVPTTYQTT